MLHLRNVKEHQIAKLKEAGLYAYNHNLDSSESYYKNVVTTRNYEDRLKTLEILQNANVSICCGGILGLGEKPHDRLELLRTLANRNPHPDSVPINRLETVPGTPFANHPKVSAWELIRIIAIARILMPKTIIRLSGGRQALSQAEQALCFLLEQTQFILAKNF